MPFFLLLLLLLLLRRGDDEEETDWERIDKDAHEIIDIAEWID